MSNTNTTTNTSSSTYLNKHYYDRELLESAKTRFVHCKFGQKRGIPLNSGKRVEFRRWNVFEPLNALTPLVEGVTPSGQSLSQSSVEAEVSQYGAYVEVSDMLNDTAYDQVLSDGAQLLGEQIGCVIEWVARDAMCAGNNVQYAGGNTSRFALEASDKLTVAEIRKAVRTLKRNKARMFSDNGRNPHFICICSPEATYDLQSDSLWQNVSAYSNAEQIYSGEIGKLFGVVFVESTEAKIYKQSVLTKVSSHSANSSDVVLAAMSDTAYAFLKTSGAKVTIGSTEYTVSAVNQSTKTITLSGTAPTSSIATDTIVYSKDAGAVDSTTKAGVDIHATLIFGKDAYGVVEIEGKGALNAIIKAPGSGGAADPLDQRATVGAKVPAFAAKILNDLWLVRVEHGVTA